MTTNENWECSARAASTLEKCLIDIVLGKKLTTQLDWLDAEPKDYIRYLRRKVRAVDAKEVCFWGMFMMLWPPKIKFSILNT
jgi:hypothetical protein